MKITKVKLEDHPGIGDLELSFADNQGTPFNLVVLAGASGTGKTAVLDAIQRTFEGNLQSRFGVVTLDLIFNADDLNRLALTANGPRAFGGPVTQFRLRYDSNAADWSAFSLNWDDPANGPNGISNFVMPSPEWRNVFRSFFNEAGVNFDPPARSVHHQHGHRRPGQCPGEKR